LSVSSLLMVLLSRALPDDALVRRYQRGNARALELLYERYKAPLLSFLNRFMGDVGEAEDAFVETWANVAQALPRYEAKGRFRSFLFTVARREALHLLQRRANRDSRKALTSAADRLDGVAEPVGSGPEEEVHRARLARRLQQELESLSEEVRACFLLHHAEGMTVPEVAEITGLSPATVKRRIGRARTILAARLAPVMEAEGAHA